MATHVKEDQGISLLSLTNLDMMWRISMITQIYQVAETGMTFEENARLKGWDHLRIDRQMDLADDSGLQSRCPRWIAQALGQIICRSRATDRKVCYFLHGVAIVFELRTVRLFTMGVASQNEGKLGGRS